MNEDKTVVGGVVTDCVVRDLETSRTAVEVTVPIQLTASHLGRSLYSRTVVSSTVRVPPYQLFFFISTEFLNPLGALLKLVRSPLSKFFNSLEHIPPK